MKRSNLWRILRRTESRLKDLYEEAVMTGSAEEEAELKEELSAIRAAALAWEKTPLAATARTEVREIVKCGKCGASLEKIVIGFKRPVFRSQEEPMRILDDVGDEIIVNVIGILGSDETGKLHVGTRLHRCEDAPHAPNRLGKEQIVSLLKKLREGI